MRIGLWNIIIILGVFLLLFGAKKIPELARSLGKGVSEFKKAIGATESNEELKDDTASETIEEDK